MALAEDVEVWAHERDGPVLLQNVALGLASARKDPGT